MLRWIPPQVDNPPKPWRRRVFQWRYHGLCPWGSIKLPENPRLLSLGMNGARSEAEQSGEAGEPGRNPGLQAREFHLRDSTLFKI